MSEEIEGLSYKTVRDSVLDVTGGHMTRARRLAAPSNRRWEVTVDPDGDAEVSISLPPTTDCEATGALCTADGRMLANGLGALVPGPVTAPQVAPPPTPFTAAFIGMPPEHDGRSAFAFELRLSEEIAGLSYRTIRDQVLTVGGGARDGGTPAGEAGQPALGGDGRAGRQGGRVGRASPDDGLRGGGCAVHVGRAQAVERHRPVGRGVRRRCRLRTRGCARRRMRRWTSR